MINSLLGFLAGAILSGLALYVVLRARNRDRSETQTAARRDLEQRLQAIEQRNSVMSQELQDATAALSRATALAERLPGAEQAHSAAESAASALRTDLAVRNSELDTCRDLLGDAVTRASTATDRHLALQTTFFELSAENARLTQSNEAAMARDADVTALLVGVKDEMGKEFQRLSGAILEEKGNKLTDQQRQVLASLIDPFSKHLSEFKEKVESSREADVAARAGMLAEIRQLTTLNQEIGAKAQSLTDALRGENKTQGMWGEAILERILELAGLREGREFRTQAAGKSEDNRRLIPDVVLDLPRGRSIVIDSKVSLVAYERFVSATDPVAKEQAIKEHVASLQRHIRDLTKKDYPQLYGLASVDFVLLFVPIESALMAASEADASLASFAIERHVALVSPNTLFTVLRTIEYVWRVELTTRNMEEIVKRGGLMFDAAVRFFEHMLSISAHLQKASTAFQEAQTSLTDPSRGLVRQAERLRALGVRSKRGVPAALSLDEDANDGDDSASDGVGQPLDKVPPSLGTDSQ